MHIPANFFYKQTQSTQSFHSLPTGAPKVSRLLAGLPAFPKALPPIKEKPKKIVISDFTMLGWKREKILDFGKVLNDLLHQDFSIYYFKEGIITESKLEDISIFIQYITKQVAEAAADPHKDSVSVEYDLPDESFFFPPHEYSEEKVESGFITDTEEPVKKSNITPSDKILQDCIDQLQIPIDQILILDDYWINHLLSGAENPGPRILRVSDIPQLAYSKLQLKELMEYLKSVQPPLEKIIFDTFSESTEVTNDLIDTFIEEKSIIIELPEDVKKISTDGSEVLKMINLSLIELSSQKLKKFLALAENIETIEITHSQILPLNEPLDLEAKSLPNLKYLNCAYSNITLENLINILHAAPNLVSIEISGCFEIRNAPPKEFENLEHLLSSASINRQVKKQLETYLESIKQPFMLVERKDVLFFPNIRPIFNPKGLRDYIPSSDEFKFVGKNKTKNQGMIIEKLSQYLSLKGVDKTITSKLQKGICLALSHYFKDLDKQTWENFINKTLDWNGIEPLDPELVKFFDTLYHNYVNKHYLSEYKSSEEKIFLGEGFLSIIMNAKKPLVLENAWHAIAIKPLDCGRFQVYDPNHTEGYLEVDSPEQLESEIHQAIGTIISTEKQTLLKASEFQPKMEDFNAFLEGGGLLILLNINNKKQVFDTLATIPVTSYSKDALDSLLLRDTRDVPTWLVCLQSNDADLIKFTQQLLAEFILKNSDYVAQIIKSIEALTPAQKGESITKIVQYFPDGNAPKDILIDSIRKSSYTTLFDKALETWNKSAASPLGAKAYIEHCFKKEQKRLIEMSSTKDLNILKQSIETQALATGKSFFYVDKPEDLICSSSFVQRQLDNSGKIQGSPGGPLYDFLQSNKNPILIINYEHFSAEDIVTFNSLLDKTPKVDTIPLPPNTRIIGLINTKKSDCYQGNDFYSRFDKTELCPLSSSEISDLEPKRGVELCTKGSNELSTVIDLFHAQDWKERLLGRWVLDRKQMHYSEGALIKAIELGKPIEIRNGLWTDPDFQRFFQETLSSGFQDGSRRVQIPTQIKVTRPEVDGQDWNNLLKNLNKISGSFSRQPNAKTLNPTSLTNFFERYEVDGNELVKNPGFLELALITGTPCIINLTHNLSEDELARLLTEARSLNVALELHCGPGVTLPEVFGFTPDENPSPQIGIPTDTEGDFVIHSTDSDTTIQMLQKKNADIVVIDSSECSASDLLYCIEGTLTEDASPYFKFKQTDCYVKKALEEGKTVCLKGPFSEILLNELAPFILERAYSTKAGRLILVTEKERDALFLKNQYKHEVKTDEKLACLNLRDGTEPLIREYLKDNSLSQLRTRSEFIEHHPECRDSNDAWLGMSLAPSVLSVSNPPLDRSLSMSQSEAHTKVRIQKVNDVLTYAPYVYLTGRSGGGKSTFVEKELCKDDSLYINETRILEWAKDDAPGKRKILFLDEANLSSKLWSEFEGLYNNPPHILIKGERYPLSTHHKVIFAGNPVSYGDERSLAPFFKRHGNAVFFEALPNEVIYEKILKPIFSGLEGIDSIAEQLFKMYDLVSSYSSTEVLISPRELEMIALLTAIKIKENSQLIPAEVAAHFSYEIAKNLVPSDKSLEFDQLFKPKKPLIFPVIETKKTNSFLITPSRQALSQQLNCLLELREYRRKMSATLNDEQKFGGLGGLVIEGEPGIGKSELVIQTLISRGYEEEHNLTEPSTKANLFYLMPVSMSFLEKEKLLIKASNEGALVVIDEINSSPMMERLLNDLLMGKNPQGTENFRPINPGFMVIGTQNPINMAGRRVASTALKRRLISTTLAEYSKDEIETILCNKGIESSVASLMTSIYEKKRKEAVENKWIPIPNFRNLMTLADNHIKSLEKIQPYASSQTLEYATEQVLISVEAASQIVSNIIERVAKYTKTADFDKESAFLFIKTTSGLIQILEQLLHMIEGLIKPSSDETSRLEP